MARRLAWVVAVCFASWSLSSLAEAHRFKHNKTLRLGLRPGELLLSITYDEDPGAKTIRRRESADRDGNGALDEKEADQLIRALRRETRWALRIEVDGSAARFRLREATARRVRGPVDEHRSLGVEFLFVAPLPSGVRTIRIEDRERDPRGHVPLAVDLAPKVRLLALEPAVRDELSLENLALRPGHGVRLRVQTSSSPQTR